MARRINKKCLHCAGLDIESAREIHGESGDGCWNPKICRRRRSHYRNRAENNAKRRQARKSGENPKTISVTVEQPIVAMVTLYKHERKDAPLHAVSAAVWQGERQLAVVEPVHCLGWTPRQVRTYLERVLLKLNEEYGIDNFAQMLTKHPTECPIEACPLAYNLNNQDHHF
ncbi:MAG: hypothetical protein QNJ72_42660 [Pleurocapsa sp. MO_226.B13]|nr:hypothetical protein [Pleurocapsa sp. MO_226.B13]